LRDKKSSNEAIAAFKLVATYSLSVDETAEELEKSLSDRRCNVQQKIETCTFVSEFVKLSGLKPVDVLKFCKEFSANSLKKFLDDPDPKLKDAAATTLLGMIAVGGIENFSCVLNTLHPTRLKQIMASIGNSPQENTNIKQNVTKPNAQTHLLQQQADTKKGDKKPNKCPEETKKKAPKEKAEVTPLQEVDEAEAQEWFSAWCLSLSIQSETADAKGKADTLNALLNALAQHQLNTHETNLLAWNLSTITSNFTEKNLNVTRAVVGILVLLAESSNVDRLTLKTFEAFIFNNIGDSKFQKQLESATVAFMKGLTSE